MQGILLINKDQGFTSHNLVGLARKSLGIKKIGHAGTLDPMATGVLALLLGKATKVSDYLMGQDKVYQGQVLFGLETDTLDMEGQVEHKCSKIPTRDEIDNHLGRFLGDIDQVPPMYSAIKKDGKKLYEYAREGIKVDRKKRQVHIHSFTCLGFEGNKMDFQVACSSGTYIRTLLADFARSMDSLGSLSRLERTQLGKFSLDQCFTVDDLKDGKIQEEDLIPMDQALDLPDLVLDGRYFDALIHGQSLTLKEKGQGEVKVYCQGSFMGIGLWLEENKLRLKKRLIEIE